MSMTLDQKVVQDSVAESMARALLIANRRAAELGIDTNAQLVSAAQLPPPDDRVWEVNYIPKDSVGQRGGDYYIEVDLATGTIRRELRGQ